MKITHDSAYEVLDRYPKHIASEVAQPLKRELLFPERYQDPLKLNPLTNRELEILKLLEGGHTAQKIADYLFISEETVRSHRKKMLAKAAVKNTTELVAYCIRRGYI